MFQAYDLKTAAHERVGKLVCGKWTLDRLIDIGGMGAVYEATHRNGKKVAIKMLHASLSAEHELKSRFLREGYIANRIKHPGALSILDDDTAEDGSAFLVMELLVGESLEDRLARSGNSLPPGDVVAIADGTLDVLAAAHDAGVVHRDIKPGNLFITTRGDVKFSISASRVSRSSRFLEARRARAWSWAPLRTCRRSRRVRDGSSSMRAATSGRSAPRSSAR